MNTNQPEVTKEESQMETEKEKATDMMTDLLAMILMGKRESSLNTDDKINSIYRQTDRLTANLDIIYRRLLLTNEILLLTHPDIVEKLSEESKRTIQIDNSVRSDVNKKK